MLTLFPIPVQFKMVNPPEVTVLCQYEQISTLLKFIKTLPISQFTIDDMSEPEHDTYDTDDFIDDEDNKTWFLQNVFLNNVKHMWASNIVEKVEKKIIELKEKVLRIPTEKSYYRKLDCKEMVNKIFAISLSDLAATRAKIKKVQWIRPDIPENTYVETLALMKSNEKQLKNCLNKCKISLKILLKEVQNYYTSIFWGKKHRVKYNLECQTWQLET